MGEPETSIEQMGLEMTSIVAEGDFLMMEVAGGSPSWTMELSRWMTCSMSMASLVVRGMMETLAALSMSGSKSELS